MSKEVIIINNGLAGGGTERESSTFANHLSENGYSVKLVASHRSIPFYKLKKNIKFVEPNFKRESFSLFVYTLKLLFFIRDEIKSSQSNIIISYNESLNPYVILASLGLCKKVFVRESMHPKAKHHKISNVLRKILYPKACAVLTQTNYGKMVLKRKIPNAKIITFPNPVEMFYDNEVLDRTNSIVTVGRLENVKGHKYLIEAFSKVNNKNWSLQIIGDGSLKSELEKLSYDLGVGKQVIFHGHLKDFKEILKKSEIFVLPSVKEGFPNALIEAMSIPLACISGDYYEGNVEIIEHGENGLLFEPCNVTDLTAKLDLLISDKILRKKLQNSAVKVRDKFSMDKVGNELMNFISK